MKYFILNWTDPIDELEVVEAISARCAEDPFWVWPTKDNYLEISESFFNLLKPMFYYELRRDCGENVKYEYIDIS